MLKIFRGQLCAGTSKCWLCMRRTNPKHNCSVIPRIVRGQPSNTNKESQSSAMTPSLALVMLHARKACVAGIYPAFHVLRQFASALISPSFGCESAAVTLQNVPQMVYSIICNDVSFEFIMSMKKHQAAFHGFSRAGNVALVAGDHMPINPSSVQRLPCGCHGSCCAHGEGGKVQDDAFRGTASIIDWAMMEERHDQDIRGMDF